MIGYDLVYLAESFERHGIESGKSRIQMIERFMEDNPGESLPDHMKEEFSLPLALYSMVVELKRLREDLEEIKKSLRNYL